MALDIEVDDKIVIHRLHNSFSQSWDLFTLELAPVETENSSLERSQDTHVHTHRHSWMFSLKTNYLDPASLFLLQEGETQSHALLKSNEK